MTEVKRSLTTSILITGLIAGTLDITAACTQAYLKRGTTPDIVFKYIASAFLGSDAFTGGTGVAALGLFMHYLIAMGWTVLFFTLYPKVSLLRGNKFVVGALYAVFVQLMMSFVLVPLTMVKAGPRTLDGLSMAALILVVCIGIPIAIGANRHFKQEQK